MTQAYNLSQLANKVNTSGQLDPATGFSATIPLASGGTGASTLTGNSVTITNAGGTALTTVAAGANGNVLTSNGTTWTSSALPAGGFTNLLFVTTTGPFTTPATTTRVKITCMGGGGASASGTGGGFPPVPTTGAPGGMGGLAIGCYTVLPSTSYTVTVGGGGTFPGGTGGTSSFTTLISATGGTAGTGAGTPAVPGTAGSGISGDVNFSGNGTTSWLGYGFRNYPTGIGYGVGAVGGTGPGASGQNGTAGFVQIEY